MAVIAEALDIATGGKLEVRKAEITPTEFLKTLAPIADGKSANVPCGSCQACCWYGRVDVKLDEETAEHASHLQLLQDDKGLYLAKREDGGCVHIGENGGCSVWEHRPRVCRTYDCRIFGMAGLSPSSYGHAAPAWEFPVETPLDRAVIMAARISTLPYMEACHKGEADPPGNVLVTVLKGIYDNLPYARKVIAQFDAMPPQVQREFEETLLKERMAQCQQE